jgi:hypothetical protein
MEITKSHWLHWYFPTMTPWKPYSRNYAGRGSSRLGFDGEHTKRYRLPSLSLNGWRPDGSGLDPANRSAVLAGHEHHTFKDRGEVAGGAYNHKTMPDWRVKRHRSTLTSPHEVLEHRAVLTLPDGTPFSEVVETYTGEVLAFPEPLWP